MSAHAQISGSLPKSLSNITAGRTRCNQGEDGYDAQHAGGGGGGAAAPAARKTRQEGRGGVRRSGPLVRIAQDVAMNGR